MFAASSCRASHRGKAVRNLTYKWRSIRITSAPEHRVGYDRTRRSVRARGADGETAQLLPRFETALRTSARLLHDLVRVDRAPQLADAFDARARGSLGGNACGCHRRAEFVGSAPGQRSFARSEVALAAARSDIDIANATDHGLRIDGNFRVGGEAESSVAAEQARDDPLVESAHRGRMLRDDRGQRQGVRPARRAWRSQRGALHDGEGQCRNDQLLHLCSLRLEPYCAGRSRACGARSLRLPLTRCGETGMAPRATNEPRLLPVCRILALS